MGFKVQKNIKSEVSVKQSEKAVALHYNSEDGDAPRLVAKGRGYTARQIIDAARAAGVPVSEDADLVEILSQIELDQEIPPDLYGAVAEILSWVYKANSAFKKSGGNAV